MIRFIYFSLFSEFFDNVLKKFIVGLRHAQIIY